jgi:hypothetical protein
MMELSIFKTSQKERRKTMAEIVALATSTTLKTPAKVVTEFFVLSCVLED